MTTRHGKIARLPNDLREELNHRLFNGAMGPELLAWLNQSPPVQAVLTQFFNGVPVNRQNLSDWRHGGYQDWLRHQERELRIQRVAEEGAGLKRQECGEDLFENSARIAIAELMVDMDSLDKMDGEQRWNRLRGLTRELARLQNAYNRSRWTELAWIKRNDQFEDLPESDPTSSETGDVPALATPISADVRPAPEHRDEPLPSTLDSRPSTPAEPISVIQGSSMAEEAADKKVWVTRTIYHRKGCGCICRDCHPEDGEYPYVEAIRDAADAKQRGVQCFWREHVCINAQPTECSCACTECGNPQGRNGLPTPSAPQGQGEPQREEAVEKTEPTGCLVGFDPVADFLRQTAHWKARRE